MEQKEPTQEKIIEAVKKYYGLKIDENAYGSADVYAYEETTASIIFSCVGSFDSI